jgi:hypothetical protein
VLRRALFPSEFMQFKAYIELQSRFKIMAIRMDSARENYTLRDALQELGVVIEYTTAYTLSQNRVAERLNRTLVAMAKAMLFALGLPQKFWGFAIKAACYIRNRLPIGPGKITLEQAFTRKLLGINNLRVFGCLAYVLKPYELRLKLDPNSTKTIFVGYEESTRQYRVYNLIRNVVIRSHNIKFFKDERLEFNWKEQLDGYLVAFKDIDSDSNDSDDDIALILTPLETSVIAPTVLVNIRGQEVPTNALRSMVDDRVDPS